MRYRVYQDGRFASGAVAAGRTLTATNGDMAWNTNAALGCGVGPVICNGTYWKHLYTGETDEPA